jgi:beta-glucosidase
VDLSREANGDVMLLVRLRRDAAAPKDVVLGMACGAGCGGTLPFGDTLAGLASGKWTTVGISLKCFQKAGVDVSKVNEVFNLRSEGKLDFSFSQVKLGTVADQTYSCN